MELPFTIVFEPPSQSELRALLRMRGHWVAGLIVALTIGIAYLLSTVARADAIADGSRAPLEVSSRPSGAAVQLDGRERGLTPLNLGVEPGTHTVIIQHDGGIDAQYAVQVGASGASLDALLWTRHASVTHLRPALPGATLEDARFLSDGELGLTLSLPPDHHLQAWRLDAETGAVDEVATAVVGPRLAFAADGQYLAYLGPEIGPSADTGDGFGSSPRASNLVWIANTSRSSAPVAGWRAPLEKSERLSDLSWSPHADRLLVVSNQTLDDNAARGRAWLVDPAANDGKLVLSIPSAVVPGSESWSPDGQHIAFIAHAVGVSALCLLGIDGHFRYVADLAPTSRTPLAYPPLTWSADGQRMLFVAPHQHPPGVPFAWIQADPQRALYVNDVDQPIPTLIGDTDVSLAAWREDGQMLGLGRSGAEGPLNLRLLSASAATAQQLLEVPLKPSTDYATAWDGTRARLLVVSRNASENVDFWLAQLGLESQP